MKDAIGTFACLFTPVKCLVCSRQTEILNRSKQKEVTLTCRNNNSPKHNEEAHLFPTNKYSYACRSFSAPKTSLFVKKLADCVAERSLSVLQGSFLCLHIWAKVRWVRPEDTSEGRKWTAQLLLCITIATANTQNQTGRIPVLWLILRSFVDAVSSYAATNER
jgi:hypothetical protein